MGSIFDIAKEVKFKLKYFYICRESFIKSELVKMPNRTSKKRDVTVVWHMDGTCQ